MSVVELERLRNRVKELEEKLKSLTSKGKIKRKPLIENKAAQTGKYS